MAVGRSLAFDYATGTFQLANGNIHECTGIDAIKQWLQLALRTTPGSIPVYTEIDDNDTFGVSIYDLLGTRCLPTEYVQAEVEREIRETCMLNPGIQSVSSFNFSRGSNRTLHVSFAVSTATEETEVIEIEYDS